MLNQFSRTEMLFGKKAMQKLASARVAVFGIGGVGGFTVEALARSGVGAIDLIDDDKVSLTNINRQIIATLETVGKYKVDVAAERIMQINPGCAVTAHKIFYLPETACEIDFKNYDYIDNGNVGAVLFRRGVCLPSDTKMTDEDLERICGIIRGLWK